MGEMVIEYSGNVIRSVLTDKREKYYDGKVRRVAWPQWNTVLCSFVLSLYRATFNRQMLWNVADRNVMNKSCVSPHSTCQSCLFYVRYLYLNAGPC